MKNKHTCSKSVLGGLLLLLLSQNPLYPQDYNHSTHHNLGGYANPELHPYADPKRGRDGYRYRNATKNESRLYDFYRRQATFYLHEAEVPKIVPAFPGLDGGGYGHWGKNNDMGTTDGRWDRLVFGPALASIVRDGQQTIPKALSIKLAGNEGLNVVFDTEYNQYRTVWSGGFLDYPEARWGILGFPSIEGKRLLSNSATLPKTDTRFLGYYLHDEQVVLSYEIGETQILELPIRNGTIPSPRFARVIEFPAGAKELELPLFGPISNGIRLASPKVATIPTATSGERIQVYLDTTPEIEEASLTERNGTLYLSVPQAEKGSLLSLEFTLSPNSVLPNRVDFTLLRPSLFTEGGKSHWGTPLPMPNISRNEKGPYSIDSLGVPLGNPFLSPMFLTGLDFFEDGNAAVSTFFGDVWYVSDFLGRSTTTTWKRIATGLHHPLGLEIVEGTIHVVGRDQITALHDLNGDQEIDFYQTVFNDFPTHTGSHDFNTGLQQDREGRLYFASAKNGIYQFSPEEKSDQVLADSIRNPNGIGVSPNGTVLTSAQEGEWTPASMIVEASRGGSYGWNFDDHLSTPDAPLVYIPRGIDNSSGGQVFVADDRWGPFEGSFLGFSYGSCSYYLILESKDGHGAIVPLPGEFLSGAHRARFNPVDGQLYVAGTQGWGTYAQYEGSFERVRRVESVKTTVPNHFEVFTNGILLSFPESEFRDKQSSRTQFFQQWNYRYSAGYGSPEYSVQQPQTVGHDVLNVTSVTVLDDRHSVFFEIPALQAAMQSHLYFTLTTVEGSEINGELFATALELKTEFSIEQKRSAPAKHTKGLDLSRQVSRVDSTSQSSAAKDDEGRLIILQAISGLQYDKNSFSVNAGEQITIRLENADTMPHNWILGKSGSYNRLGSLADTLAADPQFADQGYVPTSPDILAAIPVVNPQEANQITFTAPSTPGTYPFLCTFPGHWRIMKGTLIVY